MKRSSRDVVSIPGAKLRAFHIGNASEARQEVRSLQAPWDDIDAETRSALALLVREALLRMAENVEDWLPEAAVAEPSKAMGIFLWWQMGHIDQEILKQRARADADSVERLADLEQMAGRRRGRDGPSD